MTRILGAMRLPHWIGLGAVLLVLGGGLPSHWFGLVSAKVGEVERLSSCLQRHRVELTALVTSLGDPATVLSQSPGDRARAVRAAERRGELERREGQAIVACASTVTG